MAATPHSRALRYTALRFSAYVLPALAAAALAAVALSAAAPAQAGEIRNAGGPGAVQDGYIVVLKDHSVGAAAWAIGEQVSWLTRRYGGTVGHTYTTSLRGFSLRASRAAATRLAADPSVAYVEQDRLVRVSDTQRNPPSWGLDRIDQRELPLSGSYTYPATASAVTAYVIDTGIRISHRTFGGRARHGWDAVDNDDDASDCQGHGTHVAGTIGGSAHGVAKRVRLVAVRVLDCQGSGTAAQVIAGIDWVTRHAAKPAVANMSLGGGVQRSLDAAVRRSIDSGITYAIAAGNESGANACQVSPARVPSAITVGATDRRDTRAGFSNLGSCLDLFAPGVDITSAWSDGDTATSTISGTSMATPHVAGAAALMLAAHPGWSPQQVRDRLLAAATANAVGRAGSGSPNRLLWVGR